MVIRLVDEGLHFRGIDEIILRKWSKYFRCSESDLTAVLLTLLLKGVRVTKTSNGKAT